MAQRKKDSPMQSVFPLRTAPSQITASSSLVSGVIHQVSTCLCF